MQQTNSDMHGYKYKTEDEAKKAAVQLGLKDVHTHKGEDGSLIYMPGATHDEFMKAVEAKGDGHKKKKTRYHSARDAMYKKRLKDMGRYKYSSADSEAVEEVAVAAEEAEPAEAPAVKSPYAAGFDSTDMMVGRLFEDVL